MPDAVDPSEHSDPVLHFDTSRLRAIGWYRHPDDARRHRYWDGEEWHDQDE